MRTGGGCPKKPKTSRTSYVDGPLGHAAQHEADDSSGVRIGFPEGDQEQQEERGREDQEGRLSRPGAVLPLLDAGDKDTGWYT